MRYRREMPARQPLASIAALAIALAVGLTGCFTTAADFSDDAESYIIENDTLSNALFPDSDTTFTAATCDEPADQEVETRFACTATDSDGGEWEFTMVITGSSDYEVNVARYPEGA